MPSYYYYCSKCNEHITRMFIKIDVRHNQTCKKCGKPLELQITPVNFIVKGFSSKNSYGVHETVGEMMDQRDRELGREPAGIKLNERVLERKTRKKLPKLVSG